MKACATGQLNGCVKAPVKRPAKASVEAPMRKPAGCGMKQLAQAPVKRLAPEKWPMRRQAKRLIFLALLFAGLFPPLSAQAVLRSVRFVPAVFFVGDPVEMHIEFDLDRPMAVEPPRVMPEADWLEIQDVQVESSEGTLTVMIRLIPFAPGTRTLPSMELGTLQLRDIKIPVRSLLTGKREGVRALRGQLLLPGTRLALAFVLAFAAMAPFLGFGVVRLAMRYGRKILDAWRVGKPARKMQRLLKALKTRIGSDPAARWYGELTEALREYMSAKTGMDCRSATTAEIVRMESFQSSEGPWAALLQVLREGDMVKFAGQAAGDSALIKSAETVAAAVQEWEKLHERLQ